MRAPDAISADLAAAADPLYARRVGRHLRPLRGLRGVPGAEITRVLVESWRESPTHPTGDGPALMQLFSTAFEDGLVAIGLTAAALPDHPQAVLERASAFLGFADDLQTADAVGWLLWGPALLATRAPFAQRLAEAWGRDPTTRRAAAIAGLCLLPIAVEGPACAALRERLGARLVAFVDQPLDDQLHAHLGLWMRDEDPHVRRATARTLREWAVLSPDRAEACANAHRGGLPRFLRDELDLGLKKGRRPARRG
jgi:hypothetical protein